MDQLLSETIKRANRYLAELPNRRVSPAPEAVEGLKRLDVPLQDHSIEPATVLAELDDIGSRATVASAGNRFTIGARSPFAPFGLRRKARR